VGLNPDGSLESSEGSFRFWPKCLADLASIAGDNPTMRTMAIIFVLALITVAFEIYSDAALTGAENSQTATQDPATKGIAHELKRG
jgi:hypothetical protein